MPPIAPRARRVVASGRPRRVTPRRGSPLSGAGNPPAKRCRWSPTLAATCSPCNAASTAVDDHGIAGVATPGGVAFSITRGGKRRWVAPVLDGVHFQSMSAASGVDYTIDGNGFLDGFSQATGA